MRQWRNLFFLLALFVVLAGAGCAKKTETPRVDNTKQTDNTNPVPPQETVMPFPVLTNEELANKKVIITTAKGDIVIEFFDTAPLAVSNFVALTEKGFYNGLTFHRREEGFVIQGGDPNGNGTGDPGYKFADELTDSYKYDRGIVAMANSGANTNGSQFFIMLADYPLPKSYTIFGRVIEGMNVVDKIKVGDVMTKVVTDVMSK